VLHTFSFLNFLQLLPLLPSFYHTLHPQTHATSIANKNSHNLTASCPSHQHVLVTHPSREPPRACYALSVSNPIDGYPYIHSLSLSSGSYRLCSIIRARPCPQTFLYVPIMSPGPHHVPCPHNVPIMSPSRPHHVPCPHNVPIMSPSRPMSPQCPHNVPITSPSRPHHVPTGPPPPCCIIGAECCVIRSEYQCCGPYGPFGLFARCTVPSGGSRFIPRPTLVMYFVSVQHPSNPFLWIVKYRVLACRG